MAFTYKAFRDTVLCRQFREGKASLIAVAIYFGLRITASSGCDKDVTQLNNVTVIRLWKARKYEDIVLQNCKDQRLL